MAEGQVCSRVKPEPSHVPPIHGLIKTKNGSVIIEDWDGLREAAEFDPTYLHLQKRAA
jgi:hypothetical protein